MQRRVDIAQALLNDPEILILDEPTMGREHGTGEAAGLCWACSAPCSLPLFSLQNTRRALTISLDARKTEGLSWRAARSYRPCSSQPCALRCISLYLVIVTSKCRTSMVAVILFPTFEEALGILECRTSMVAVILALIFCLLPTIVSAVLSGNIAEWIRCILPAGRAGFLFLLVTLFLPVYTVSSKLKG